MPGWGRQGIDLASHRWCHRNILATSKATSLQHLGPDMRLCAARKSANVVYSDVADETHLVPLFWEAGRVQSSSLPGDIGAYA